jgi:hypothetical protein
MRIRGKTDMRGLTRFSFILALSLTVPFAAPAANPYIWAEYDAGTLKNFSLFLGGNPREDEFFRGVSQRLPGKLTQDDWPTLLRTHPPVFILTAQGLLKTTAVAVEVTAVRSLKIDTASISYQPSAIEVKQLRSSGIARIGQPFPPAAKLTNIPDKNALPPALASIPGQLHAFVAQRLGTKKSRLAKLDIQPRDFSFAPFLSPRGPRWLAWYSDHRHRERRQQDSGTEDFVFAAVLNPRGAVEEILRGPKFIYTEGDSAESWTPVFRADLDAKGHEEIIADVPYYEGKRIYRYSLRPVKGFTESFLLYDGS